MIPDEEEALALHKKYGSDERILRHCQTVNDVAMVLTGALVGKGRDVNEKAVVAGALLHDIGRTRTQTVHHGHVGAELLASEGVDQIVVEIVKRHVGAGISSEEATALGFPPGDYVPDTIEERVVCFADKMVSADTVRPFEEEVGRFVRKGHDVNKLNKLKQELAIELGEDPERVVLSKA